MVNSSIAPPAPAKASTIARDIKGRIRNGSYTDMLPSSLDLAKEYSVNPKTINKALRNLVEERLIVRIPGKGTFLRSAHQSSAHRTYAVCGQLEGHLYQSLSGALFRGIQDAGGLPVPLDPSVGGFATSPELYLRGLLDKKPDGIVVIGGATTPYDTFYRYQDEIARLVFVQRMESDLPILAASVISDYWYGTYIATRHLIEQGHDRILFVTHRHNDQNWAPPERRHKGYIQQYNGYLDAIHEDGDRREYVCSQRMGHYGDISGIKDLLLSSEAPTAMVADSDFRLTKTLQSLEKAGIGAGSNTPCVGFFNTPWAESHPGGMSSVDIQETELGTQALRLLLSEETTYERVVVKPQLVIRNSSRK
ncbi:MAG: GntR family transcriptional regulator [Candidatus Pacebacteria bacterium]|nr:GntR family transcriptional regulator [Candidatus Paceibacterota bacterium]